MAMRVNPGVTALIVILVVLHFVLRIGLGLGAFVPDLLIIAVLIAAREMRPASAALLGLLLGLLEGAAIPYALGPSALALTLLGYLGSRSRELFSDENPIFYLIYLFLGKWLYDGILYVVTGLQPGMGSQLLLLSPLAAFYAALIGLAAVAVQRKLS